MGPTWDAYDLTNSRHHEECGVGVAFPPPVAAAGPGPAPGPAAITPDDDVLFQNLTTPSVPPVITYPWRGEEQACITVRRGM
jgi:hypothetical protein